MAKISSYKELIVWQKAFKLSVLVYKVTDTFPQRELYSITSQMRRSSISIPSNIAEGYNRNHRKEFIQFLQIAYGSAAELETQLLISKEIGYLKTKDFEEVHSLLNEVLKMLNTMASKLKNSTKE